MIRGFAAVDEITPNAGPEEKSLFGRPNFGGFVKLKNSARNCKPAASVILKSRWMPRSRLSWLGPRKIPTPQLPKPVPSPMAGGAAKPVVLKYPFKRSVNDREGAGSAPVHSARRNPVRFP